MLEAGSRRTLTAGDVAAIRRGSGLVDSVGGYLVGRVRLVAGNRNWTTAVAGITPGYFRARQWVVREGSAITPGDDEHLGKVVVVGETVARALFGDRGQRVGRRIRINNTPFRVVGVLQAKGQSAAGRDQDNIVFMPISTARVRVLGRGRVKPTEVSGIVVRVTPARLRRAAHEIRLILRQRHRLWPDERDDFRIRDLTQIAKTREAAIRQFTILVGIIASVSLFVGGIGIMNTVLISVAERTREIGIRLAVGAQPSDIRGQFLVESLVLSTLGGILGVLFGMAVATALTHLVGWPAHVSAEASVMAFLLSALIGLAFGLYPALKAARTEPSVSLRVE